MFVVDLLSVAAVAVVGGKIYGYILDWYLERRRNQVHQSTSFSEIQDV